MHFAVTCSHGLARVRTDREGAVSEGRIQTGKCVSDWRLMLRRYKAMEKGDDIFVVA